jgi:hypothetical protein
MVKWKVLIISILIIFFGFIIFPFIFLQYGISVGPLFTYIVIFIAIVLTISAFLPHPWNKFCREIFYIGLFICILSLEMSVFNAAFTTLKPPEVTLQKCTTLFGTKDKPTEAWDAIGIWSCVTAGYFPSTYSDLGWTIFFIFYLLLPFVFIFTLLYGLMNGINLGALFGKFAGTATKLLSFIITMYATRQLFGFFLLDFYGYGAWGIAGVFGATMFVMFLRNIMEKWFIIEEMAAETRKMLETQRELEKQAISNLKIRLNQIRHVADKPTKIRMLRMLADEGTPDYQSMTAFLESTRRNRFRDVINTYLETPDEAIELALRVLS